MKILFKPIITAVCLLLTMSAFGQESLQEAYDNLVKKAKEESYIQDARKGLEYLKLKYLDKDVMDFTAEMGSDDNDKVFLESSQYLCKYYKHSFSFVELSCLDKETYNKLYINAEQCFLCD